jgi:hypothetical protein
VEEYGNGYPLVAAFFNSDEDFMMCRRFGVLHQRILLKKQDEICQLEEKLDRQDEWNEDNDVEAVFSRRNDTADSPTKAILDEIEAKLVDYGRYFLNRNGKLPQPVLIYHADNWVKGMKEMLEIQKPTNRNLRSVKSWLWNQKRLSNPERMWITHKKDMIALQPGRDNGWFDGKAEAHGYIPLNPSAKIP